MPTKRMDLQTTDLNTGEVVKGVLVWAPKKQHSMFSKEGYVSVSQKAADMLANAALGEVALRVLWKLLAILDMENWINIQQSELAEEMGLRKTNFSTAMKKLKDHDIILEGPKVGRSKTYRLNPHYGWKGSTENHINALNDHPLKERMKQSKIENVITGGKTDNSPA